MWLDVVIVANCVVPSPASADISWWGDSSHLQEHMTEIELMKSFNEKKNMVCLFVLPKFLESSVEVGEIL